MSFPFSHVEHRAYPRTFLHSVSAVYLFDEQTDLIKEDGFEERIAHFLQETFNLKMGPVDLVNNTLNVRNEENLIQFSFSKDNVSVSVDGRKYLSFKDSLWPHIETLGLFLKEVFELSFVKKMAIRKMNAWTVEMADDIKLNRERLDHYLISDNVRQLESMPLNEEKTDRGIYHAMRWTDRETCISEECSFVEDDKAKRAALILDLKGLIDASLSERLDGHIVEKWEQLDQIVFDAFHWCVNPIVIKMMSDNGL